MLSLIAAVVLGQAGSSTPAKEVVRRNAIWASVYNRFNLQTDVWWEDGDFPKIISMLRFQAELFPHDYDTATNLGWMYENVKDDPNAEKAYARYAQLNPQDPDAMLPVVQKAYMAKDYQRVIKIAQRAIERKGVHPNVYRLLAHSYERTNEWTKALAVWDAYLTVHPKDQTGIANREKVKKRLAG